MEDSFFKTRGAGVMKKNFFLIVLAAGLFISITASNSIAANTEVVLDSQDGTSNFAVKDSGNVGVASIDSDGNIVASGTITATGTIQQGSSAVELQSNKAVASGYASLNASSLVVQNPANATATPTGSRIPISDGSGKLDGWITLGSSLDDSEIPDLLSITKINNLTTNGFVKTSLGDGTLSVDVNSYSLSSHNHSGVYQSADSDLDDLADGTLSGSKVEVNSSTTAGVVSSGSGQVSQVWKTDASGNPAWRTDSGDTIPVGVIVMWSGTVATIPSGWALCNGSNGTPDLRDRFIVGARQDNGGVAMTNVTGSLTQTGGAATHNHGVGTYDSAAITAGTPAGTVSQPTFSGSALAAHGHGTGTYATSAHSGTAVADHASHTHTYTSVINHTHTISVTDPGHVHTARRYPTATGGSSGFTADTSMSGTLTDLTLTVKTATTGITASSVNPAGGVATGTSDGPSATLTHSVTQPSAHTLSGSSSSDSAGTPSGTVSQPTFTGSALGTHDHTLSGSSETVSNLSPYYALAFIMKL